MPEKTRRVAVVTGGTRGIGRGIVLRLGQLGYDVAFNYLKSESAASQLTSELEELGVMGKGYQVDVSQGEAVKDWIAQVKEDFQRVDVLINNAGIIIDKALMMMSYEDWQRVIDTNLNGMFYASRACIVTFMKQRSGQIINISSISGLIGMPRQTNYAASKGGMNAFTKSLAKEVAPYGIYVNAVCPGFIETEMIDQLSDSQKESFLSMIPLKRFGKVDDVVRVVCFLLSDAAAYMTGQVIQVDGGLSMR